MVRPLSVAVDHSREKKLESKSSISLLLKRKEPAPQSQKIPSGYQAHPGGQLALGPRN